MLICHSRDAKKSCAIRDTCANRYIANKDSWVVTRNPAVIYGAAGKSPEPRPDSRNAINYET